MVNDVPPKERDIAMVFQNYALYPHMKVRDNMAFSLLLAKRPTAEIDERVRKAAGILGLAELLDRYPRQLSGGQRQRVAMGRAIVRDPQVFLFDEPLSNLDAKLRVQMRTEIKELHQRLKTTSVYVTHDQIEAMTMADQIVVMRDGVVEQRGTPLELYDQPANLFVAGFIGSPAMNFLPGTLRRGNGAARVEIDGGLRLPAPRRAGGRGRPARHLRHAPRAPRARLRRRGLAARSSWSSPPAPTRRCSRSSPAPTSPRVFRERHDFRPGEAIRLRPDHAAHAPVRCGSRGKPGRLSPSSLALHQGGESHVEIHETRFPEEATAGAAAAGRWLGTLWPGVRARRSGPPEKGAKLRVLRWKRFVQGDEDKWLENTKKFTEKTGIEVRVDSEGWEDVRPKAAVAANVGSGPDIIISTFEDAHQYPDKLVDVTDVCNYLGGKYGGWYDVCKAYCVEKEASGSPCRWAAPATRSCTASA